MNHGVQRPVGAPPRTPPPRTRLQQEWYVAMGRRGGDKRNGLPAGVKTRLASPLEVDSERGGSQGLRSGGKPRGGLTGSGRGGQFPKGTDTPRVKELPQREQNLRSDPRGQQSARSGRIGTGRGWKLPIHPIHQGEMQQQPRRGDEKWEGSGGAADPTAGHRRGRERIGDTTKAS